MSSCKLHLSADLTAPVGYVTCKLRPGTGQQGGLGPYAPKTFRFETNDKWWVTSYPPYGGSE